jgi:hypothetical protein
MRGGCLCGAVRFEAEPSDQHSHACHCEMCRRWTGAVLLVVPVPADALRLEGEDRVRRYRSSEWAERGFCGTCGSSLFYRLQQGDYFLALGVFDEPDELPLASEIYIDRKTSAFDFAGERPRATEAEVEAKWAERKP